MVETNKSEERQPRQEQAKIAVTNAYRHRTITFSVTGGSIRLGPLETRALERDCLHSPELSQLILDSIVQVRELGVPAAVPAEQAGGRARSEKKGWDALFSPSSAQESKVKSDESGDQDD